MACRRQLANVWQLSDHNPLRVDADPPSYAASRCERNGVYEVSLFALFLLLILPRDGVLRDAVEVIEVNHLCDDSANETLCQVIFWQADGRCAAWRLNNQRRITPVNGACWFVDEGLVRCVRGLTTVETWTQGYDPEIADRVILPVEKRRGLRK